MNQQTIPVLREMVKDYSSLPSSFRDTFLSAAEARIGRLERSMKQLPNLPKGKSYV